MSTPNRRNLTISIVSYSEPIEQLATAVFKVAVAIAEIPEAVLNIRSKIIIVDNRDTNHLKMDQFDKIRRRIEEYPCELAILQGQGNVGYGKGHNLAFKEGVSGIHLYMNPDVEVEKETLKAGLIYLDDNPDVGMVSPFAVNGKRQRQYLCKRYPSVCLLLLRGFNLDPIKSIFTSALKHYEMRELTDENATKSIPIVSGCFMLVRNELIERVNGFSPKYFLYFEDFDLSLRISEISKIAYLPAMKIVHYGGNSASKGALHIFYFIRSAFVFFSTHGWRWSV